MKKLLLLLTMFVSCALSTIALEPQDYTKGIRLDFSCKKIVIGTIYPGTHRTPPASPTVYFDSEGYYLYFESPIDCTLQLTTTDTQEIVFSTDIQDGEQEILLPGRLCGEYELQIIVGQFVFYTTITL